MSAALSPSRLQSAEHYYSSYAVVLPDGLSLDDALKPEFWAHVAQTLRQHDTIRIIPEDASYFAEALVLSAGRGFAKLKLLREVQIDAPETDAEVNDQVEVKFKGPHLKHCIIRKSDGHILKDSIALKQDALREAAGYKLAA